MLLRQAMGATSGATPNPLDKPASRRFPRVARAYWQEKANATPPAVKLAEFVTVRIVPAGWLLPVVKVQVLPAELEVAHDATVAFVVQVVDELEPVTLIRDQVSAAPTYEVIVMLGLHAAGKIMV